VETVRDVLTRYFRDLEDRPDLILMDFALVALCADGRMEPWYVHCTGGNAVSAAGMFRYGMKHEEEEYLNQPPPDLAAELAE